MSGLDRSGAQPWRKASQANATVRRTSFFISLPPVSAAGGDGDDDQAENEIGADEFSYDLQLFAGGGEIAGGDGLVHAPVRDEEQMQKDHNHDDADGLHDMNIEPGIVHTFEHLEDHPVTARRQQYHCGPDPGEETREGLRPQW